MERSISYGILLGFILLGFVYIPAIQYLTSLLVGGIVYKMTKSIQNTVVSVFATSILFSLSMYTFRMEGFRSAEKKEGFMATNPSEISKRVDGMKKQGWMGVKGVGSQMSEGFEDAGQTDMTLENPEKKNPENVTASSKPAPINAEELAAVTKSVMNTVQEAMKNPTAAGSGLGVPSQPVAGQAAPAAPPAASQGFKGSAEPVGLFKLGSVPNDAAGGFHIDAGTTVVNALKSLQPDQLKSMTEDTRKLIDTQKTLMEMLHTFKPLVSEGKEMMETFGQMFSPTTTGLPAKA
jgi:hypothetical protein